MKNNKVFYGWWLVLFSALSLAVMGPASVAVANLFQNPVTHEFGITNSQFAISNSLVLGMGIFLSPFISKKLAFGNFRLVYIVGVMIYGLAYIGFGFAPNMYVFYALALLVGVGNVSTTIIPVSMLVNNWFVKKRGLALSLSFTGLGVGGVIFSQAVTFLITNVGWRYTYLIYGLIILLVGIPIGWFVFRARPEDMGMTAYGAEEPVSLKEGEKEVAATTPPASGVVVTKPYFILLLIGGVMVGLANNGGLGQFPPVLADLHGPIRAATLISLYSAVGIVGKITLGNITDRFGTVFSTIYAAVLLTVTYLVMTLAENYSLAIVMAVLFGLGNAVGTVAPPLITAAIYAPEDFSKAYGYLQSALLLGMTAGSLFAAGVADLTGSYNYSWIALAIASAFIGVSWVGAYCSAQKDK